MSKTITRSVEIGEIIAWRAWRVIPTKITGTPLLGSYARDYIWGSGCNQASEPPREDNTTGFYALKTYEAILNYWGYYSPVSYCLGTVSLYGDMIFGTDGYRAEYAVIDRLVSLVRATPRPPRINNGTAAWRRAVEKHYRYDQWKSFDPNAGKPQYECDTNGPLIRKLREIYCYGQAE